MNCKLVSLSILFVLISLLLAKHLKYHYFFILFLSVLLIYLIDLKLITYLDNETFQTQSCNSDIKISFDSGDSDDTDDTDTTIDSEILEKIMENLNNFN